MYKHRTTVFYQYSTKYYFLASINATIEPVFRTVGSTHEIKTSASMYIYIVRKLRSLVQSTCRLDRHGNNKKQKQ